MKKIKFIAMLFIAALVFISCQNEDTLDTEVTSTEKYPEIASKLQKMYFSTGELKMIDITNIDGTVEKVFQIEGDIIMTREQIMNMQMGGGITTKQYQTYNLVSIPWWEKTRTINVWGYSGSGITSLGFNERMGLWHAIREYNALNLKIKFELFWNYSRNQHIDIRVFHHPYVASGAARSGFPSGGNPYPQLAINTEQETFLGNKHLIMHELGHVIGMRHADWSDRCGRGVGEFEGEIGALHIPGTSSEIDLSSIMTGSCGSRSIITGEFNEDDIIALNYLY